MLCYDLILLLLLLVLLLLLLLLSVLVAVAAANVGFPSKSARHDLRIALQRQCCPGRVRVVA